MKKQKPKDVAKVPVFLRLDAEDVERIDEMVERERSTRSIVIRQLLARALEQAEKRK